jgi:hypothetical protein
MANYRVQVVFEVVAANPLEAAHVALSDLMVDTYTDALHFSVTDLSGGASFDVALDFVKQKACLHNLATGKKAYCSL